jgi:hypothetical protein
MFTSGARWNHFLALLLACGLTVSAERARAGSDDGVSLAELRDQLSSPEPLVRQKAVERLILFGQDASVAKPQVLALLMDEDKDVRLASAVTTLTVIDTDNARALAVIRQLLADPTAQGRTAKAICTLAPKNDQVRTLFLGVAVDKNQTSSTRQVVLSHMKHIPIENREELMSLARCLDEDYPICASVADLFREMGSSAAPVVPLLEEKIKKDRTPQVNLNTYHMARALSVIDPCSEVPVPYFVRLTHARWYEHRLYGLTALRERSCIPASVRDDLKRIAQSDPYDYLRDLARETLDKSKPGAEKK